MSRENGKFEVGDWIELRYIEGMPIDDEDAEAKVRWELVEIVALRGFSKSGAEMLLVRHNDGHERLESSVRKWRWLCN